MTRLTHIHLSGLTPYLRAAGLQEHFVRQHLDFKARPTSSNPSAPPSPTLLTFSTLPTYTCGRREIAALSKAQISHLRANGTAEFHEALRGGQTTFHGPGQLTAYLICSLDRHHLSARCYVRLLEEGVIGALKSFGLAGAVREDSPGVWVMDSGTNVEEGGEGEEDEEKKVTSVGVHLRRRVSSHGIGLNVCTNLEWFRRITACGLPGNLVTNMVEQLGKNDRIDQGARILPGSEDFERLSSGVTRAETTLANRLPDFGIDLSIGPPQIVDDALAEVAQELALQFAARLEGVERGVDLRRMSDDEITEIADIAEE